MEYVEAGIKLTLVCLAILAIARALDYYIDHK